MEIYNIINSIFLNKDFIKTIEQIKLFAELTLKVKNKKKYVDYFYKNISIHNTILNENILSKTFTIFENQYSIIRYIMINLPLQTTPVKSLKEILLFCEKTLSLFTQPLDKPISKDKLIEILSYFSSKYDFFKKLFLNKKIIFSILNTSNQMYNNECIFLKTNQGLIYNIFLYSLNKNGINEKIFPEAVLFHEFGHIIHSEYTQNIDILPKNIINELKLVCFPTIDELSSKEQSEILADVFSIGLFFNTPFEKYDPFNTIHIDDKKFFKKIVNKILK
ncbi:hypothetical protein [uncultured Fusobacterium sp.]|uniref:hypothetical protein n=1 Tax=uncultured Fusobacterium sp. TaxID=159267 RepID=UPI0015A6E5B2|nr:hypothetical protein [uncultured Fusobacterium sp.]